MRLGSVWRELPAPNRRWLVVNSLLVTMAINVIVNAAIAWLGVKDQDTVTMWGVPLAETSIFWNVVGTLFLLPLITCVLTTTAIRRDVRRSVLAPLDRLRPTHPRLAALPLPRWRRGALLGAMVAIVLAPPILLLLVVAGVSDLSRDQFVACQTVFAVLLGVLVTPPIALFAMADPPVLRDDPAP
ncbi:MAG: hypothetical protein ACRDLL_11040 [Solirubrobacterales bacterium]